MELQADPRAAFSSSSSSPTSQPPSSSPLLAHRVTLELVAAFLPSQDVVLVLPLVCRCVHSTAVGREIKFDSDNWPHPKQTSSFYDYTDRAALLRTVQARHLARTNRGDPPASPVGVLSLETELLEAARRRPPNEGTITRHYDTVHTLNYRPTNPPSIAPLPAFPILTTLTLALPAYHFGDVSRWQVFTPEQLGRVTDLTLLDGAFFLPGLAACTNLERLSIDLPWNLSRCFGRVLIPLQPSPALRTLNATIQDYKGHDSEREWFEVFSERFVENTTVRTLRVTRDLVKQTRPFGRIVPQAWAHTLRDLTLEWTRGEPFHWTGVPVLPVLEHAKVKGGRGIDLTGSEPSLRTLALRNCTVTTNATNGNWLARCHVLTSLTWLAVHDRSYQHDRWYPELDGGANTTALRVVVCDDLGRGEQRFWSHAHVTHLTVRITDGTAWALGTAATPRWAAVTHLTLTSDRSDACVEFRARLARAFPRLEHVSLTHVTWRAASDLVHHKFVPLRTVRSVTYDPPDVELPDDNKRFQVPSVTYDPPDVELQDDESFQVPLAKLFPAATEVRVGNFATVHSGALLCLPRDITHFKLETLRFVNTRPAAPRPGRTLRRAGGVDDKNWCARFGLARRDDANLYPMLTHLTLQTPDKLRWWLHKAQNVEVLRVHGVTADTNLAPLQACARLRLVELTFASNVLDPQLTDHQSRALVNSRGRSVGCRVLQSTTPADWVRLMVREDSNPTRTWYVENESLQSRVWQVN